MDAGQPGPAPPRAGGVDGSEVVRVAGERPAVSGTGLDLAAAPDEVPAADLAAALRTGPFPVALDLAVRRRQLSLESLQRRLAERGVHVGLSTLSYWRRGRRHPEGERSARVLTVLESVLDVPRGSLLGLAGVSRDRRLLDGGHDTLGLGDALGLTQDRIDALSGIDLDSNLRLHILSAQFRVRVNADRDEESVAATVAVRSRVDGADRFICLYEARAGSGSHPVLGEPHGCRVGRVRTEDANGLVAAELRFDNPLRAGETYVFDYELHVTGQPQRTGYYEHGLRVLYPLLSLRVRFDPAAIPVRCYRYYREGQDPTEQAVAELPVGASLEVRSVLTDAPPGVHGIRWEWD
jgi:hypothetical protein